MFFCSLKGVRAMSFSSAGAGGFVGSSAKEEREKEELEQEEALKRGLEKVNSEKEGESDGKG